MINRNRFNYNRKKASSESVVMNEIFRHIIRKGYKIFRANVGSVKLNDGRYFKTGLPKSFSDLFGVCKEGKAFFIECKTPNGKATKEQVIFLEEMRLRGAYAGIATNIEEADDILKGGEGNVEKAKKYIGYTKKEETYEDFLRDWN